MDTFWWIFLSGVLMSVIALVGSVTLLLSQATLGRIIMPLVAFAAGSLLSGAFFYMLAAAILAATGDPTVFLWTLGGFAVFFALEQFLHWHHCHPDNGSPSDQAGVQFTTLPSRAQRSAANAIR